MFCVEVGAVDGVPDPLGLGDRLVRRTARRTGGSTTPGRGRRSRAAAGTGRRTSAGCRRWRRRRRREKSKKSLTARPVRPSSRDPRRLEDVEALDDHDVGALDHDLLVGHHVVDEVGVDRRLDLVLAGLDVDDEPQQRPAVVGLREALAVQDARGARARRWGSRKPSVVTSATWGCSGQWASICCSTRAVVDLPTATEPASPITNGVRGGCGRCRNSSCSRCSAAGGLDVQAQQPGQRQVDLLHLVEVELRRPGRAAGSISSAVSGCSASLAPARPRRRGRARRTARTRGRRLRRGDRRWAWRGIVAAAPAPAGRAAAAADRLAAHVRNRRVRR